MNKNEFLAHVQKAGDLDDVKEAERWSIAVVVALSQLLPDAEARRHFASQLPGFLKSRLRDEPPVGFGMDREAFAQHIAHALGTHVPTAERALRAVYAALKAAISPGQIADIEAHIPRAIAAFVER